MTLPRLNGSAGAAISLSSVLAVLGGAGYVIQDRIAIEQEMATRRQIVDEHERRLRECETRIGRLEAQR